MNRREFLAGVVATGLVAATGGATYAKVDESDYVIREYRSGTDAVHAICNAIRSQGREVDVISIDNIIEPYQKETITYAVTHIDNGIASIPHIIKYSNNELSGNAVMHIPSELYVGESRKHYDELALSLESQKDYQRVLTQDEWIARSKQMWAVAGYDAAIYRRSDEHKAFETLELLAAGEGCTLAHQLSISVDDFEKVTQWRLISPDKATCRPELLYMFQSPGETYVAATNTLTKVKQ